VEKLLIEEHLTVARELYAGITLDPLTLLPQLMISPSGGMDIETAAHSTPGKLYRLPLDPLDLPGLPQVIDLVLMAGLQGEEMLRVAGAIQNLIRVYFRYEAVTAEINPLIIDAQGRVLAADAKLEIDDSALGRVKEAAAFVRTERLLDPLEAEARAADIVKMRGYSQDEGWAILEARQVPIVKFGTTEEAVLLLMAKLTERGVRGSGHTG
jgi:succinyl-CoA synthetase beta subunit